MFGFGKKPLVTLQISATAYDEIANMIPSAVDENGVLDMSNIGLTRAPEPVAPAHRPISGGKTVKRNSAPGAIS